MRTRIFTLSALLLALGSTVVAAQSSLLPPNLKSASAALVVDRLLAGREALALSADQAAQLTLLSTRLHRGRGHLVIAGLDRVPGKSVPRIERTGTTAAEAFRQASALLTPAQQARAGVVLKEPRG